MERQGKCPKCGMDLKPKKISVAKTIYQCPMDGFTSDKPGKCAKCGMELQARKVSTALNPLAVPRSAVIDAGGSKIVYVETGTGLYERKKVKLGHLAKEDYYVLLGGLAEGDKVATAGNFLLDAQANITSGASMLYSGASEIKKEEPKNK